MSTTVDVAESGRKPAGIKPLRAARQSRDARIQFWRMFIVTSFFVIVIGANVFAGAVAIFGRIHAQANAENAAASRKIAQVRRPLLDGTFCRNIVFDNKTAQTIVDKVERCDSTGDKPKDKGKSDFTWGGK